MKDILFCTLFLLLFSCNNKKENSKIKLNQIQVIGSHNSYKKPIDTALFEFLKSKDSTNKLQSLEYAHIPIPEQLNMGVRNLEIDVYSDTLGGKYAHPKGLDLISTHSEYDVKGEMKKPGFKVFHVLDIDFNSHYFTLESCLKDIKEWSDTNPFHYPVFITLEAKDGETGIPGTEPESFTTRLFDKLDTQIIQRLGKDKLIIPDDVRDNFSTLEEAVLNNNWPSLEDAKGKFLFILDNAGRKKDLYTQNHPSLKNRVMFVNSPEGTPEAAAMIINNPLDERIPELIKKGYLIRTRADAGTKEARENDYSRFEAAKKSGAQIITTDYYKSSSFFNSTYHISFKDSTYVRNNPVNYPSVKK
ncbi:phosphatidylinositol-specific phospholipase C1-like protein [Abyssalbus ytuae]|uniref:Phosphatidylinositol-specific phospholipase C1-like protein n=1 Tax=Abyssalbus ytuae TaxID=2926907 RepID=A0A9E7CTD1_9FLAO|nr:phosphatidylinositol-specific phospholipase C1-like protein [Abyssalbus ytuae]UOB17906.1 phosphatidylinositol-specific phospholipase C1-like protein [Abyssalbus ytuae]